MPYFQGEFTSVTMNSEDLENVLDALKPLTLRFRFGEVGLYDLSPVIINHASKLFKSGSVIEAELFDRNNSQL